MPLRPTAQVGDAQEARRTVPATTSSSKPGPLCAFRITAENAALYKHAHASVHATQPEGTQQQTSLL